jgi:hypothetical protein
MRNQFARFEVVSERHWTTHPHPLLLRSGDFVPNPFSRHFSFKLCKRKENVEGEPTHGGGGVELLGYRDERHSSGIKGLNNLCKIRQAASETIYLVYDDDVDLVGLDVLQQTLQCRSLHRSAGVSTVIVASGQYSPAFMPLAEDEGLAGFSLCIERVEGLFEIFFRGLSSVDRTANGITLGFHRVPFDFRHGYALGQRTMVLTTASL